MQRGQFIKSTISINKKTNNNDNSMYIILPINSIPNTTENNLSRNNIKFNTTTSENQ